MKIVSRGRDSGLRCISCCSPARAGEGLLVAPVHAHGAKDGLSADGTLHGPGLVAV